MRVLIELIVMILDIYKWVMLVTIIAGWLIAFNVVNTRNQVVDAIWRTLLALTEPVLRPIRRWMPRMQIDISPIIVFLGIWVIQAVLLRYVWPYVF